MARIAYVNGRYRPLADAVVSIEDRAYQFADAAYDVIAIEGGRLIDGEEHLARLDRSLAELRIPRPMSRRAMRLVIGELVGRNRITRRGIVYLQVSRGVAPREHAFPRRAVPSMVVTARPLPPRDPAALGAGVAVITLPDSRWNRPDIKSVSLLPNVLAKQRAVEAGAYEAWLVDRAGTITEGTASNAWIVTGGGELLTRAADRAILNGITRRAILRLAGERGITFTERPFSVAEAKAAAEAFLTSTTSLVKPVVRIDETPIGNGRIGPLTARLLDFYLRHLDGSEAGE